MASDRANEPTPRRGKNGRTATIGMGMILSAVLVYAVFFAVQPPGRKLVIQKCSGCHSLSEVWDTRDDARGWNTTVERMKGHGAKLTPQQQSEIVRYLASRGSVA